MNCFKCCYKRTPTVEPQINPDKNDHPQNVQPISAKKTEWSSQPSTDDVSFLLLVIHSPDKCFESFSIRIILITFKGRR